MRYLYILLATAALLPAPLPGQREALTLTRLIDRCDAAGLLRTGDLQEGEPGQLVLSATCLRPLKLLTPQAPVQVLRRPAFCHTPDLANLRPGREALFFLRRRPATPGLYELMPGGLVPGDAALWAAAMDLAGVESHQRTALLMAQLSHPVKRVRDDAMLTLLRLPEPELLPWRDKVKQALAGQLEHSCAHPGPLTSWYIRLALRLELEKGVAPIARLALATAHQPGAREFLVTAMRRLDAAAAAGILARATPRRPQQRKVQARLLGDLGQSEGTAVLVGLTRARRLPLRLVALQSLARVAPDHRLVRQGLHQGGATGRTIAAALQRAGSKGRQVLAEESATDSKVKNLLRNGKASSRPRFKALFPGRRR